MSKETFRNWLDKQSSTIDLSRLEGQQDRHGIDIALPDDVYDSVGGYDPTVKKDGRTQRTGHACADSQPPRVRKITIRYSVWTEQ